MAWLSRNVDPPEETEIDDIKLCSMTIERDKQEIITLLARQATYVLYSIAISSQS